MKPYVLLFSAVSGIYLEDMNVLIYFLPAFGIEPQVDKTDAGRIAHQLDESFLTFILH